MKRVLIEYKDKIAIVRLKPNLIERILGVEPRNCYYKKKGRFITDNKPVWYNAQNGKCFGRLKWLDKLIRVDDFKKLQDKCTTTLN